MRLGLTNPALLDPAAAAAAAAFLVLGPAAAAPSALRLGAELMAVRLRLREGAAGCSVLLFVLAAVVLLTVSPAVGPAVEWQRERPESRAAALCSGGRLWGLRPVLWGLRLTTKILERYGSRDEANVPRMRASFLFPKLLITAATKTAAVAPRPESVSRY